MKKMILLLFVGVLFILTACSSGTCSDCRAAAKGMGIEATPSLHEKLCK